MNEGVGPHDHEGRAVNFGKTFEDYDRFRPGFPESFFERLGERGWIERGVRCLDVGTGTGTVALGLATRGLEVVGLDVAPELLAVASRRAQELGVDVSFLEGRAEETRLESGSFGLATAGQCWWWFDEAEVLDELRRVLEPNGRLIIAGFSYLPRRGTAAGRTEDLILEHNPGWAKANEIGFYPEQVRALDESGFREIESFSYVERVAFTHEAWRGRIRACNGVGAALRSDEVERFDQQLAEVLASEFPEPLEIPHRIHVVTGLT